MEKSDLFRGNVDTVILKVLFEGDRYGYDMIKQINARSGGQWEIKQATFYAVLKKLEKQGFVTSYWDASESNGGRRKYYTLTDSGRDVFVSYKSEWERSRDLFGELITDDTTTILPSDDFSDVDDDDYAVPKRRSTRPRAKKPKEQTQDKPPVAAPEIKYDPPAYDEHEYALAIGDDTDAKTAETSETEPEPTMTAQTNAVADEITTQPPEREYVQQSMFESYAAKYGDETVTDGELPDEPTEEPAPAPEREPYTASVVEKASKPDAEAKVEPTADPRAIIDELYASTYTGNRSYADARRAGNDRPEPYDDKAVAPVAATTAIQPAAETAPAVKPTDTAIQPYESGLPKTSEDESPARKAYKDILGDLIERSEARTEAEKNAREAEREQESAAVADAATATRFDDVRQSMSELGNNVVLREHDDAPKQYAHKYHYYSNRLMMTHYTTMCAIMFMLGLLAFLTFYFGLGMRMKYDYLLYVAAGLLPIVLFIAAVIIFAGEPDKSKRINVNFRFSIIIRIVIMVQVAVIVYCVNLILGMPVSFSAEYLPTLIIPCIYALFIPISEVIFMTLLKSEHYAV